MSQESASYDIKTLRGDRYGLEENFVAEATLFFEKFLYKN